MVDMTFRYLTYSPCIDKIRIEPSLKKSFIRVMNKMDEYFYKHGYTAKYGFNFDDLFYKFLLTDNYERFAIITSDEPSKTGASGLFDSVRHLIHVDSNILN